MLKISEGLYSNIEYSLSGAESYQFQADVLSFKFALTSRKYNVFSITVIMILLEILASTTQTSEKSKLYDLEKNNDHH